MSVRRVLLAVLSVTCACGLGAVPADAGTGFGFSFSFNGADNPGFTGGFAGPVGVAVNTSGDAFKGDVYVVDQGHGVVDAFNAAGEWQAALELPGATLNQLTVDDYPGPGEGDVYVAGYGDGVVSQLEQAGPGTLVLKKEVAGLGNPTGVAVDAAGDIFISRIDNGTIAEFNAAWQPINAKGEPVAEGENVVVSGLNGPQGLAVSSSGGDLYAATGSGTIQYTLSGGLYVEAARIDEASATGVLVAPAGEVFVDQGSEVAVYEPAGGNPLARFGSGILSGGAYGIAVSATGGDVYIADNSAGLVDVFQEGNRPEAPTTEAPGEIQGHSVLLQGTLNPPASKLKEEVEYYFVYNTGGSCEGASETPKTTAILKDATLPVTSGIGGLLADTQYTVCLVVESKFGSTAGAAVSFTTMGVPPVIESESASVETDSEVTLAASVNPEDQATTCVFQYLTEAAFNATAWANANTTPCSPQALGEGGTGVSVTAHLTGLVEGVGYEYRVLASNAFSPLGGTPGPAQSFQALLRPAVSAQAASQVHPGSVLLSASVNPNGVATSYHFAYGPTAGYGSIAPASDIELGEGSEGEQALETIEGLQPGTTYHYALVATSKAGVQVGPDETFTTLAATPPIVSTGPVSEVSQNAAMISGTVDPQGVPTSYEFDLGTDTTYGSRAYGEAGAGGEPETLTLSLQGLAAGTLYHYRLIARNTYGTVYGVDQTFTTPGFPTSLLASPVGAPLIPGPTFTAPSTIGASVGEAPPSRTKHKTKTKTKAKKKKAKKTRKRNGKAARATRGGRRGR
jgi:hypothetical protein